MGNADFPARGIHHGHTKTPKVPGWAGRSGKISSRVPICLHPRLHGGASTSHFWSAGPGLLLLSALPELSHYWRSLSVRNCCQDWPSAPYQQGFTTRHIPCASPIACKECLEDLASRLTPWTHIHHMSQRACINCPTCPSDPRHEIPVPEAQKTELCMH